MVVEGHRRDTTGAPTTEVCPGLVDAVPADSLLQRSYILEAGPSIRSGRSARVRPGDVVGTPPTLGELVAGPACDSQLRVGRELRQQPLEEIRFERHVGVELDHEVERTIEGAQPGVERDHVASASATLVELAGAQPRSRRVDDTRPRNRRGELERERT